MDDPNISSEHVVARLVASSRSYNGTNEEDSGEEDGGDRGEEDDASITSGFSLKFLLCWR